MNNEPSNVLNRRVRLLLWKLFYGTPLTAVIDETVERDVARHCKVAWADYCRLKATFPELWQRGAVKRAAAQKAGGVPLQPRHLLYWRKCVAKRRALARKERPRFTQWAAKKLIRQRGYKRAWLRNQVLDRLMDRLLGL